MSYVKDVAEEFKKQANPKRAAQQKAYMRGQFEYFGLTSPIRKEIQKPILLKQFLPPKNELHDIVKECWALPQREMHYFAMELTYRYVKSFEKKDMKLFEYLVIRNSWWDTIDYISPKMMSAYFKTNPNEQLPHIDKWNATDNIWLKRCGLIFQLHYKNEIDTALLEAAIIPNLGSSEFFINKAIGWILRNYSRVNPEWVIDFADKHELSNLSKREALRLI